MWVEFNFEPVKQLREKSVTLKLSNGLPGRDVSNYVVVQYPGNRILSDHFCYATLLPEEQSWFVKKIMEIVRLSEDFNLNTLFYEE